MTNNEGDQRHIGSSRSSSVSLLKRIETTYVSVISVCYELKAVQWHLGSFPLEYFNLQSATYVNECLVICMYSLQLACTVHLCIVYGS